MTQTPKTHTEVILADQADAMPGQWIGSDINLMHELWPDLDPVDFRVLLRVCMARGLNPLDKEIYPMVYNKGQARGGKNGRTLVLVESIDAYRRRGHSAGLVVDLEGPEFRGPSADDEWTDVWTSEDPPFAARFGIQSKGMKKLAWAVRLWSEVAKKGKDDMFWKNHEGGGQPVLMLGIAAERQAWRRFCPGIFNDMYGAGQAASHEGGHLSATSVVGVEEISWDETPAIEEGGKVVADEDGVIDPETPAEPPSEPEAHYDMGAVLTKVLARMQSSDQMYSWGDFESVAGWPEGADKTAGIAALLEGAVGSEDELAGMVFDALQATRS